MSKNIIHITIDSLRADVCGFLNGNDCTPYLSSLADESIVFESAIAPGPRTPSSVVSTMTGDYFRHEKYQLIEQRRAINTHISTHESIPEQLNDRGYKTLGFTANPWTASDTGFREIFDEFYELNPNSDNEIPTIIDIPLISFINRLPAQVRDLTAWDTRREWFTHWTAFYEDIIQRLTNAEEPYYAWIFIMDTHQPYFLPPQFRSESNWLKMYWSVLKYERDRDKELPSYIIDWLQQTYRDAARSADEFVRRIHQDIQSSGTTFVIHSDHGESHGEHNTYGHEFRLYEENIHVPLLINGVKDGERVSDQVSLIKLPQMIDDIATGSDIKQMKYGDDVVVTEGESRTVGERRGEKMNYKPHDMAVRTDDYKYILSTSKDEFYHLSADPNENQNIAGENREAETLFRDLVSETTKRQRQKWEIVEAVRRAELDLK